jgi:hypothetical protein
MRAKCTRCHRCFISGEARSGAGDDTHENCEKRPEPVSTAVGGALARLGAGYVNPHRDHACTDLALMGGATQLVHEASESVLAVRALWAAGSTLTLTAPTAPILGRLVHMMGAGPAPVSTAAVLAASREKIFSFVARLDAVEYRGPAFDTLRGSVGFALSCVECVISATAAGRWDCEGVFLPLARRCKTVLESVSACWEGEGCSLAYLAREMFVQSVPLFNRIHADVGSPRFPFQNDGNFVCLLMTFE